MSLREFTVSPKAVWNASAPWGGGHTVDTDPTRRGWRLVAVSADLAVIGRVGKPGCFSAMSLSGGQVDLAIYDDREPGEVTEALKVGRVPADAYRTASMVSGWALPVIEEIEKTETATV